MVPGAIDPELFGMKLDEVFQMAPEEYCARVLARICEAALQHHQSSAGMMINYDQLPEAVWTGVADFFGVEVSDADMETFRLVARVDAKNPGLGFETDSQAKRNKASETARVTAARWLAPLYEQLETARLSNSVP
jgi:hypothetical protein